MGSGKYRAGVLAGCASSRVPGEWPPAIPGLGPMQGGHPFAPCDFCPAGQHAAAWTFVRYGSRPVCKACAIALAKTGPEELPFVTEALRRAGVSEPGGSRGGPRMPPASDGLSAGPGGAHNPTPAAAPSRPGGLDELARGARS